MELVNNWWAADRKLADAKKEESKLRKEVKQKCFSEAPVGTHNVQLGGGYKFKAEIKQSTSLTKEAKENNGAAIQQLVQQNPALATLFTYEPKMSMAAYKNLTPELKAVLAPFIEVKDSTPSFSMIEPKE
jgi:hypothetical protein